MHPEPVRAEDHQSQQMCKKTGTVTRNKPVRKGLTPEIPGVWILCTDKPTLPAVFTETFEELRL